MIKERTLILIKPDALNRGLMGEIIGRFERKGLKIVGLKMTTLTDEILDEHYAHHKEKDFFADLKGFMKSAPIVAFVLEGESCVEAVRLITGATVGSSADAGTIRGDLAMTNQNLLHASDSVENATKEIDRFFAKDEIHEYKKADENLVYENR